MGDLATWKMHTYYVAAHHTIQTKKACKIWQSLSKLSKYTIQAKNKCTETVSCSKRVAIAPELY